MTKKRRAPWFLAALTFCPTAMGREQKMVEEKSVQSIEPAPTSDSSPPTAPESSSADRAAPSGK